MTISPEMIPWLWLGIGIVLIVAELTVPSFTIIWFGLGALIVSATTWILPNLDLSWQISLWTLSSICFTSLWYICFKPKKNSFSKDQLKEAEGETGLVVKAPKSISDFGTAKFTTPVLGAD